MRVIAGSLKGRIFESPHGHHTHPMSDKIRGALFNVLGSIKDAYVCDVFSGSGAIALEAISHGAASVVAIESDRSAQYTIQNNVTALGLKDRIRLIKAPVASWLATSDTDAAMTNFDIVICDPPYDSLHSKQIVLVAKRLKVGGILVLSLPPNADITLSDNLKPLLTKSYGDASLRFYERE